MLKKAFSYIKRKTINVFARRLIIKWNLGPKLSMYTLSTEAALIRISRRNLKINTVIDIGASDGRWSEVSMKIYPNSNYYLIEAQSDHKEKLKHFKASHDNVTFEITAAGNYNGTIQFDNSDLYGGVALETPIENSISVPIKTVDSIVSKESLKGPYLLKLDTHGFEKQIFEGAIDTLRQTNLIVVETYNFEIAPGCLRFHEICFFLEEKGFRCIDVSEPLFRDLDGSFWQIDMLFIRNDRPEFLNNNYR